MNPFDRLTQVVPDALEQPPDAREAFLDAALADAPELRQEAAALISAALDAEAMDALRSPLDGYPVERPGPALPNTIGPWRVTGALGEGGMGIVVAAERTGPGFVQRAAVKRVRAGTGSDFRARFLRERGVLAALDHPGIARLLDAGVDASGAPYLAMERVDGRPITEAALGLPIPARLALFAEACDAVAYAHRNLVVHRDLKPAHIVVEGGPQEGAPARVRLLDFGVAKLLGAVDVEATGTSAPLTLQYAAPEQVRPDLGPVTTATDVYALGLVLFEVLAERRPYALAGATASEAERLVCETPPSAPSALGPPEAARLLRGDLDTITRKALEKDPARRYPSAEALAADVRRHLAGRPVEARPASWAYAARRFVRRNRVLVAAGAVTLCAVLVGAGVAVWQARTAAAARDAARGEAAKAAAISTFLEQTLLAAGPTVGAGVRASDLRVVDVLRPAADRAQTAFPDQPDVRAAILYTVGRTYLDLGLWTEAERATMAALALRDSLHGRRPHLDRIQSADEAARLAKMRNAERDALGWGARALAMRQQLHGAESLSAAEGLGRYADLLAWFGHFDDAFARHREALALADRVGQSRAPEAADIRLSFALLHLQTGQVAAADSVLGQLERLTRGTDTATRALGLHYRAGAALFLGEIGRAERLNAVARRALEARFEASHPLLNEARGIHAALLVERGRFAEAERIMRRVAEAFEASLGGTTRYEVHLARAEWGAALAGLGRTADAERLLRPATDRLRATIGDGNPWTRHQAAHLADLYDRLGRPADARRYRQVATAP